jgi:hypothetical protein
VADPGPLLRELVRTDRRGAVWCTVLCAASVAHLVPPGERRPGRARLLAAAWAVGLAVSEARLLDGADAVDDATADAADAADAADGHAAWDAVDAAYAACTAVEVATLAAHHAEFAAADGPRCRRR